MDANNESRRTIARLYIDGIHNSLLTLPQVDEWEQHVFHIFPIFSPVRDRLQAYLTEMGIQTLIHYPIPPHKQGALSEYSSLDLPVTERIHREVLSLPLSPQMSDEEVGQVIAALNRFE